jgi:hypothetical protein
MVVVMSNLDSGETDVLVADPAGARPSPIPGMSLAEFDEIRANIEWFSALSLDDKLAASRKAQRWAREVLATQRHGS